MTLWGSGHHRSLSGDSGAVDWDGELAGAHFGVDTRLGGGLLAGLALSWQESELDYTYTGKHQCVRMHESPEDCADTDGRVEGVHETRMRGVHPYVSWSAEPGSHVWAMPGYGDGEVEIEDDEAKLISGANEHPHEFRWKRETGDLTMKTAAAGGSLRLAGRGDREAGGAWALDLKGEGWLTRLELDGNGSLLAPVTADASRIRVAVEASHESRLADVALLQALGAAGPAP